MLTCFTIQSKDFYRIDFNPVYTKKTGQPPNKLFYLTLLYISKKSTIPAWDRNLYGLILQGKIQALDPRVKDNGQF